MFERYLRRYVGRVPITPAKVLLVIFVILILSCISLHYYTAGDQFISYYIIYDNPGKLPESGDPQELRLTELAALKTALTLGYILNRTVILPVFHCSTCTERSTSGDCDKLTWSQCELQDVYDWATFKDEFGNEVKPLHFLSDHAVRERLLEDSSPLYVFDTPLTRTRTQNVLPSDIKLLEVDKNAVDEIAVDVVKDLLIQSKQHHMLRFHSLYLNIKEEMRLGAFYGRLTKAFVPIHQA